MHEQYRKGGYKYNPHTNSWKKISIHQEKAKLIQENYTIEDKVQTQLWENNGKNLYRNVELDFEVENGFPVGKATVLVYDDNELVFHYDNGVSDNSSKFKALFVNGGIMFVNPPRGKVKLIYIPEEAHVDTIEGIIIHNGNEHLLNICGINTNILEVYKDVLYCDGNEYHIESDKLYFYIEKKDSDYIITVNSLKLLCPIKDNPIVKVTFNKNKYFGYHTNGQMFINNLF